MNNDNSDDTKSNSDKLCEAFGSSFSSPHVLPLGYQCPLPPDDKSRCDMPGCHYYSDESLEWKILSGCWHSFHVKCLKGRNYCPLCKTHLLKEIQRLGKIAQQAIFADTNQTVDENQCENADEENEDCPVDGNEGFDPAKLQELQNLRPRVPGTSKPSQAIQFDRPTDKPSHCKKCGHVVKGHKRPRNQPVQCPSCPNQICCEAGKGMACSCQWHQPIPANQVQAEPILVSTEQNVTVLSFPEFQSQATLSSTESSNACTAISLLACCSIYYDTFPEISHNNLKDIQDNYVSLIMKGNAIYDIIEPPLQQPNLEVDEVLAKMEMPIKIGQGGFRGIYDLPQLKTELSQMFADKDEMCAIMITPPDKSFTLCKTNRKLILFESHSHCDRGAIIAFTDDDNVADFCDYINMIIVHDWKSTVQYSNLTPIVKVN